MVHKFTHTLKQQGMTIRDEPAFRFKIPHKCIIKNQKKSMPRETEKHKLVHLMIGRKQTCGPSPGGRDQKEPGLKSEGILSRWSWSDIFCLDFC